MPCRCLILNLFLLLSSLLKQLVFLLLGGMLADEVTQGMPIAADVACENEGVATLLSFLFTSPAFKVTPLKDVIGKTNNYSPLVLSLTHHIP